MKARSLPKHNTSNGYFRAPDFIFDECPQLSSNAKLIFCNLCRRINQSGNCFPSQERIGRDCGIKSPKTVRKGLNELEDAGLIYIKSGKKGSRSDSYQFTEKIMKVMHNRIHSIRDTNGQNVPNREVNNTHDNEQNLPTKEYTKKENKFKERVSILNQHFAEEPESSLDTEYIQINTIDSKEPTKQSNGNSISRQKYQKSPEDLIDRKDDVSHEKMVTEFDKLRQTWERNSPTSY